MTISLSLSLEHHLAGIVGKQCDWLNLLMQKSENRR
jgi:hypothetical protein